MLKDYDDIINDIAEAAAKELTGRSYIIDGWDHYGLEHSLSITLDKDMIMQLLSRNFRWQ